MPEHERNGLRIAVLTALTDTPDGLSIRQINALPAVSDLIGQYGHFAVRNTIYGLHTCGLTYISAGTVNARHFLTQIGRQILPIYEAEL